MDIREFHDNLQPTLPEVGIARYTLYLPERHPPRKAPFYAIGTKVLFYLELTEDRRSYALLPETYTKPRNRFLARVRNPNPALATNTGAHE